MAIFFEAWFSNGRSSPRSGSIALVTFVSLIACACGGNGHDATGAGAAPPDAGTSSSGGDAGGGGASSTIPELQPIAPPAGPYELPDRVYLKSNQESYNRVYYFAVKDGGLWAKPNVERTGTDGPWQRLTLPPELDGTVSEISTDDYEIIVLDSARRIWVGVSVYGPLDQVQWKSQWGFPFGTGPGYQLPPPGEVVRWEYVSVGAQDDLCRPDFGGNCHSPGSSNVSHIWKLDPEGQRLAFNDPWLPRDFSYGMCTPLRGRFKALGMSGSGSHELVVSGFGDMWTRLFDFDIAGMNTVFVTYSYEDQPPGSTVHQLPAASWLQHPKIHGKITDHISLHKIGTESVHRIMRVEGVDAGGNTGYFEKDIIETTSDAWVFHRTDRPLTGRFFLDNRDADTTNWDLGPSQEMKFSVRMGDLTAIDAKPSVQSDSDWAAEILDFHPYCSPATLRIHLRTDETLDLILHTVDGLRVTEREPGLDSTPRAYNGAIEIPQDVLAALPSKPAKTREFVQKYLGGQRFTSVPADATASALTLKGPGWPAPWVLAFAPP